MHPEAHQAVVRFAHQLGLRDRPDLRVLDVGGRNVNGTVRDAFHHTCTWTTLDHEEHPSVDVVADAREWLPDFGQTWDVVVSTETLEHVDDWRAVLRAMAAATDRTGTCLVTCASTGRPVHSCTGEAVLPPGEHYGNVSPEELREELEALFSRSHVEYYVGGDAYAWARYE